MLYTLFLPYGVQSILGTKNLPCYLYTPPWNTSVADAAPLSV